MNYTDEKDKHDFENHFKEAFYENFYKILDRNIEELKKKQRKERIKELMLLSIFPASFLILSLVFKILR